MSILTSEAKTSTLAGDRAAAQREILRHCFDVVEALELLLPVAPTAVEVNRYTVPGTYSIRLIMPSNQTDFGAVQDQFGGVVTTVIDDNGTGVMRRLVLAGRYVGIPFQVTSVQLERAA